MIFGTSELHTTRSGVMQILSGFYHNKHLTARWRHLSVCKYVRVSKRRNITTAKMSNLGATICITILNIKLLCFPRCVPELLLSHLTSYWNLPMHSNVGLILAGPPCISKLYAVMWGDRKQFQISVEWNAEWLINTAVTAFSWKQTRTHNK